MYFANEDGQPGRPLSHDEMVEDYRYRKFSDLQSLPHLYTDFHFFSDVVFLHFEDNLGAAIFLRNSAQEQSERVVAELARQEKTDHVSIEGWEGEAQMMLEENRIITKGALQIARGAASMAALVAIELLITDLLQDGSPSRNGLVPKFLSLMNQVDVTLEVRAELENEVRELAKLRNAYAHQLTGSPWNPQEYRWTQKDTEDIFFRCGRLAVRLEDALE